jgi:hypothetical protein
MSKRTVIAPEGKIKQIELGDQVECSQIEDRITPAHRSALARYEVKKQYLYPIERITQDHTVVRNVKFPDADKYYPNSTQALFRFVSKFYPNAKGGPLWVDEPKNEGEIYRAYERQKVMKKIGLRHVVYEKDTSYENLLEQLGEGF